MRRRLTGVFVVAGLLVAGLSVPLAGHTAELKIGYVDILKVFNDYTKTKTYDGTLEEKKEVKEKKLETKKEEIKQMQERLDVLGEKERETEKEKIQALAVEFRETERQFMLDLKKERDEKMKEIIEDINKVIDEYSQKEKYDLVFNKGAVLFGKKGIDLTDVILKIVNQRYKK